MTSQSPRDQSKTQSLEHDPAILDDDRVLRVVKTSRHVIPTGDGSFAISPQHYTTLGQGCSCELESLFAAAGETQGSRITANRGIGGSLINVATVRGTMNRLDEQKKPKEPLDVAYTPIADGQPFGPNPYHSDIFPKLGNPGSKKLALAAVAVDVDAEAVRRDHAERHGTASAPSSTSEPAPPE